MGACTHSSKKATPATRKSRPAAANRTSTTTSTSTTSTTSTPTTSTTTSAAPAGIGDFDGDGRPDNLYTCTAAGFIVETGRSAAECNPPGVEHPSIVERNFNDQQGHGYDEWGSSWAVRDRI